MAASDQKQSEWKRAPSGNNGVDTGHLCRLGARLLRAPALLPNRLIWGGERTGGFCDALPPKRTLRLKMRVTQGWSWLPPLDQLYLVKNKPGASTSLQLIMERFAHEFPSMDVCIDPESLVPYVCFSKENPITLTGSY